MLIKGSLRVLIEGIDRHLTADAFSGHDPLIYSREQLGTKRLIPLKKKRVRNSQDKLNLRTKTHYLLTNEILCDN